MKRKRVWRYWCEHCRKGGCSAGHMAKHEKSCTLNPGRTCRMCLLLGITQTPLGDLIALVQREPLDDDDAAAMLRAVEVAANGCPTCVFSALRQSDRLYHTFDEESGGPARRGLYFDYKAKAKDALARLGVPR